MSKKTNRFYVLLDPARQEYYAESQPHYHWSYTVDLSKARQYRTLAGTHEMMERSGGTFRVVPVEQTLVAQFALPQKEVFAQELDDFGKLHIQAVADIEVLSETDWKRYRRLGDILEDMGLIEEDVVIK